MVTPGSTRSYETRVDNILNGTGPVLGGTDIRLQPNGAVGDRTVFDDGERDKLKGDQDRDWFFAGVDGSGHDDVKDQKKDEFLEPLSDAVAGLWTNPRNSLDVNNDGFVSPLDVLILINMLDGPSQLPNVDRSESLKFYDVNDDNYVSPIDVLWIINALESSGSSAGEGETGRPASLPREGRAEHWDLALEGYLDSASPIAAGPFQLGKWVE